jgi:hypothetical protein
LKENNVANKNKTKGRAQMPSGTGAGFDPTGKPLRGKKKASN